MLLWRVISAFLKSLEVFNQKMLFFSGFLVLLNYYNNILN